jgi:hypothetical protein
MDGVVTEWHIGQRSLGGWHTGANELFSGTQVANNFYNGILSFFERNGKSFAIIFIRRVKRKKNKPTNSAT